MTDPVLRSAAAHVLVGDVEAPALDANASHHLFRVLRVRVGEVVTVTDGAGRWRQCRAVGGDAIEPDAPVVEVAPRSRPVTIGFAIPKQDRPEWIVQKLTELGVDRIVLLHAERSVVRWSPDRAAKHLVKLGKIAAEALQQSRRVWLPEIAGPIDAAEFLPHAAAAEPFAPSLGAEHACIAIGPEGGWSPGELARAAAHVSLGPTVLRVETAAISAAVQVTMHVE